MRGLFMLVFLLGCDDPAMEVDCSEMSCFRPYVCAETCDGPTTNHGCCTCPAGQLDVIADCPQCDEGCSVVCEGTACECSCPEPAPVITATVTDRPCSVDEECQGLADCDCACTARLRSVPMPEGEAWRTMCNGGPPPNCGAESPCATQQALCTEGACVLEPAE